MPRKTRDLIVTVTFEANRLEEQNINMAYELVLPIKQGSLRKAQRMPKKTKEVIQQLQILEIASNQ